MYQLTYRNESNKSIVFNNGNFTIINMEGFGDVGAQIQTQKAPYQDGSTALDSILEERPISLEIAIQADNWQEVSNLKRMISSVFNPKLAGTFYYSDGSRSYEITGYPEHVPSFPDGASNQAPTFQRVSIDVLCPNPYWRDPQEVSRALRAYEGKFTFPFTFPVQFGTEGDITELYNEGDTSTPVTISIQGPIRRPMIENRTTGQYIRVNTAITAEEVLYIDTSRQHKRVEIHRGNQIIKAMGYLDHNSDFWQLEVGENNIRYTADEGIAEAIAAISWYDQYVGI